MPGQWRHNYQREELVCKFSIIMQGCKLTLARPPGAGEILLGQVLVSLRPPEWRAERPTISLHAKLGTKTKRALIR